MKKGGIFTERFASKTLSILGAVLLGLGSFAIQTCQAASTADPIANFTTSSPPDGSEASVTAWRRESVRYNVVGDHAAIVINSIDRQLKQFETLSKMSIHFDPTSDILMIFNSNVFDDLKHNPQRFLAARIPMQEIDVLTAQAEKAGWQSKCLTVAISDLQGNITSAIIIAKETDDPCITPTLFDVFGIKNAHDGADSLSDFCILYAATRRELRTPDAIRTHVGELNEECASKIKGK